MSRKSNGGLKSVTPPTSPPIIRRSSDVSSPNNIHSLFRITRLGSDLPTDSERPPAATLISPPSSVTVRKGKHKKVCSWKLGTDGDINMPALGEGGSGELETPHSKPSDEKKLPPSATSHTGHSADAVDSPSTPCEGKDEESTGESYQLLDEHTARLGGGAQRTHDNKKTKKKKKDARHDSDVTPDNIDTNTATVSGAACIEADKASVVSKGSNTSSMFSSTRAKLKRYLSSSSRKKIFVKSARQGLATGAGVVSPVLELSARNDQSEAKEPNSMQFRSLDSKSQSTHPSDLFEESKASTPLNKSPCTPTSGNDRSYGCCEESISDISPLTPERHGKCKSPSSIVPTSSSKPYLPCINLFEGREFTTRVINLPWSGSAPIPDCNEDFESCTSQLVGQYSGPVNSFLQPHGRGTLVLKSCGSLVNGTWNSGKLVSHLIYKEKPLTDDVNDFNGCDRRRRNDGFRKTDNASARLSSSLQYAVDKSRRIPVDAPKVSDNAGHSMVSVKPKSRAKYNIGDACRTPQDMIICHAKNEATESVGLLKKWDGAFIKRSSGIWTYAVLIERSMQPVNIVKKRHEYMYWAREAEVDPSHELEDSMLFAINGDGGTKIIPKHCWAKYIRRVQRNHTQDLTESRGVLRMKETRLFSHDRSKDVQMYR